MLGFHSFSENPFSALTGDIGATKTGSALLSASGELLSSGSQYISGLSLLSSSGELSSAATLYISAANALENSGTLTANGSLVVPGASLLLDAGTVTANGTLIHGAISAIEGSGTIGANSTLGANGAIVNLNSGTLTANGTLQVAGTSALEGSGTLGSDGSNALTSATLKLNAGTLTSNGTLYITSDSVESASGTLTSNPSLYNTSQSLLEASGTLGSNATMGVDGASLLLHAGTLTAYGTLLSTSSSLLENSGTLSSNGTIRVDGTTLSGKTSVVNSGELSPGGSLLAVSNSAISGSGTITSNIMVLRGIEAVVGITYDEFAKTTQRLNYKPALPRLQNNDIALDFAINEGAGSVFSSTSRRQKGTTGNLSWGRVDGRMSLTSPGGSYSDYRISASSNGLDFNLASFVLSFKPTLINPAYQWIWHMRGTSNNNNEIDIYCRTSTQQLFIDVYDNTTLQRTTLSNVPVNTWNTLVITVGADLKAYLNGALAGTHSSIIMPSTIGNNIYIGGNSFNENSFGGSIDHFRWYNRQLSAIEVANLSKNISQDYYFNSLVPNHYEMSRVTGGTPVLTHNIAASLLGQGTIPNALPWLGGAYFESSGTLSANGVILSELDVVPFTAYINQIYNKTMNVNRLYTKSLEK